jgi:hypothetical protein
MVAYICNPTLRRLRQEDLETEASLGYKMRPSLNILDLSPHQKKNTYSFFTLARYLRE